MRQCERAIHGLIALRSQDLAVISTQGVMMHEIRPRRCHAHRDTRDFILARRDRPVGDDRLHGRVQILDQHE